MWRSVLIVLLLANAAVWVWTRGWLDGVIGPARLDSPGEPERLGQQVAPEGVVVFPLRPLPTDRAAAAQAAARAATSAPLAASDARPQAAEPASAAPAASAQAASAGVAFSGAPASGMAALTAARDSVCLQGGPFTDRETRALVRASLAAGVPDGGWTQRAVPLREDWVVYIGPLRDRATLQAKLQELQRLGVSARELPAAPDLQPGVLLARAPSSAAATDLLANLAERGVRTARVVDLATARPRWQLRLEAAPSTLLAQLQTLNLPAAAADKRQLGVCRPADAGLVVSNSGR